MSNTKTTFFGTDFTDYTVKAMGYLSIRESPDRGMTTIRLRRKLVSRKGEPLFLRKKVYPCKSACPALPDPCQKNLTPRGLKA